MGKIVLQVVYCAVFRQGMRKNCRRFFFCFVSPLFMFIWLDPDDTVDRLKNGGDIFIFIFCDVATINY